MSVFESEGIEFSRSGTQRPSYQKKISHWRNEASDLAEAHDRARVRWRRFRDVLQVPIIVFSALTAVILSIQCKGDSSFRAAFLQRVGLAFSLLTTILNGVYNLYNPGQRSWRHAEASARYESLERDLEYNLSIPYDPEENYNTLFMDILHQFAHLNATTPDL